MYTPEEGITLDMLRDDVRFLQTRYRLDPPGRSEGRLVIRNEAASNVYSTAVITKMLQEEGGQLFDARSASLGHTLQGGIPSPLDRARAARLSLKCLAFIEREHGKLTQQTAQKTRHASPESAAVITIQASSVRMVPVREMLEHADMVNRRGKEPWWLGVRRLESDLAGRSKFLGM